jgi:hypothetical protein
MQNIGFGNNLGGGFKKAKCDSGHHLGIGSTNVTNTETKLTSRVR